MSGADLKVMDREDSVSMVDVLEEQSRLLQDVAAVLGAGDENSCTYVQGYINRQPLYACSTCCPDELAGICLACSYKCHEGHELYELYTKRLFRCDCGNKRFGENRCCIEPIRDDYNIENRYNHNFKGTYCSCNRTYPDPDNEEEDEMIQCCVCEDWYHLKHLDLNVPMEVRFEELICNLCMDRHGFLWAYHRWGCGVIGTSSESDVTGNFGVGEITKFKDSGNMATGTGENSICVMTDRSASPAAQFELHGEPTAKRAKQDGSDRKLPESDVNRCAEPTPCDTEHGRTELSHLCGIRSCVLEGLRSMGYWSGGRGGAALWMTGWRSRLCRCPQCTKLYKMEGLLFLLDEDDTISAYQQRSKERPDVPSEEELQQRALSEMNHIQQIEVARGYHEMQSGLKEFLKSFAEQKKVVTKKDIEEFFEQLKQKKRQEQVDMQYNCK